MYLEHFKLKTAPFKITPDTDIFYTGGERGAIFQAIRYSVLNGDAIIKVIGEVGSGKTMLCRKLESELPDHVDIVYLANPKLSPNDALNAIANELKIEIPINNEVNSKLNLLKLLHDYLIKAHCENRQVVIFIEEAQSMPMETLEEIRMLGNLETQQSKLFQIALFGQPELDDNLAQNHVRQIRDRITSSFYLNRLNQQEVSDYLLFKLYSSGYQGQHLFSTAAIRLLKNSSKGLLRRINILADKALLACYCESAATVCYKHVKQAIADTSSKRQFLNFTPPWQAVVSISIIGFMIFGFGIFSLMDKNQLDINNLPPSNAGFTSKPSHHTKNDQINIIKPIVDKKEKTLSFLDLRKLKTLDWLQKVNLNNFTIQVLLTDADSVTGLERFLRQKEMATVLGTVYVYKTSIKGIPMIGVLYGDFKTYTEARSALDNLPAPLRRYQPYIRNIRDVIAEKQSENNGFTRDNS